MFVGYEYLQRFFFNILRHLKLKTKKKTKQN